MCNKKNQLAQHVRKCYGFHKYDNQAIYKFLGYYRGKSSLHYCEWNSKWGKLFKNGPSKFVEDSLKKISIDMVCTSNNQYTKNPKIK